jgi:hypothetical protein
LQVLNIKEDNFEAFTLNYDDVTFLCNNVVGQLGADFIYQHNWKIDFEKKK